MVEEVNVALAKAIGRPRSVLDVGCGIGLNGAIAKARGAKVTGIEIVPERAERARQLLDEVISADLETDDVVDKLGDRRFDLMLFGDVLEHTKEPRAVLERLAPLLEDGGHVVVSLPNVAAWTVRLSLLGGRFDYEPSGILDDTHLRFFTRKTAMELVEAAGLEILHVDQNPMLVRAARKVIGDLFLESQGGEAPEPTALTESTAYRAYMKLLRPVEDVVARASPELLSFQNVVIGRKRPKPGPLSLTVGMLTMDEEESIEPMMGEIRKYAPDAKVLCVDSSKDKTPEIARRLGARIITQYPPRGHGPAMELLMYNAADQSDALIYLDCDFTYPPECIPRIRKALESGVDVVNACRTRGRQAAMPVPNYMANRFFAYAANVTSGVPTVDVHSGMRGYRSSVIRAFDFDGEGDALPIDTLLFPAKCGYRVIEAPIPYDERVGPSKLRKLAGTVWTFIRLAKALPIGHRRGARYEVRDEL